MRGTVLYGPRDVRFEDRESARIEKPTDAILRIAVTCVCGSDLSPSGCRGLSRNGRASRHQDAPAAVMPNYPSTSLPSGIGWHVWHQKVTRASGP